MKVVTSGSTLLDRSLKCGLIGIALLLVMCVSAYLSIFNNGLAAAPDNWSAFGAFFGGVFGPAVSLVTLFAIQITIDIQRELLLSQKREFDLIRVQQSLAHQVQVEQADFSKLSEYKSHQLQLLDQQINMFERMLDRYETEGQRIFELGRQSGVPRTEKLAVLDRNINEVDAQVGRLIQLSVEVSLAEFKSIQEISARMKEELQDIAPKFFRFTSHNEKGSSVGK